MGTKSAFSSYLREIGPGLRGGLERTRGKENALGFGPGPLQGKYFRKVQQLRFVISPGAFHSVVLSWKKEGWGKVGSPQLEVLTGRPLPKFPKMWGAGVVGNVTQGRTEGIRSVFINLKAL